MATTSTVPVVSAALASLLTTELADPDTLVSDGPPPEDRVKRRTIYLGDTAGEDSIPTMGSGRQRREEDYTIELVISYLPARGTGESARAQAFLFKAAVEDVLADNPTLGLGADVILWARTTGWRGTPVLLQEAPAYQIVVDVNVRARLT